ncbi:MAG: L-serine ammonia-lyase, iron-sulfur-dependent, subunit alpha [Deltaproteobacteria bacterium]|nr:L-serine ammonia-lyase, iron-sulfur-dependent, subunit alpha [Deltaproteobacteria bacterium]
MRNSSIFNEVFGPVMVGPSSSHTAGPARIGKMCRQALPDEPEKIDVSFDRRGSFAATYVAQGSNYGFVGGILGRDIGDENIKHSLSEAREKGVSCRFNVVDLPGDNHPNFAVIEITARNGFKLEAEAASTGGGMFEISRLMGREVSLKGDLHEFLLFEEPAEGAAEAVRRFMGEKKVACLLRQSPGLLNVKTDEAPEGLKEGLEAVLGRRVTHLLPALPVVKRLDGRPPFDDAAGALASAEREGVNEPWRLAAAYESALSGKDEQEILSMMASLAKVMRRAAERGLAGDYRPRGFLPPQSPKMRQAVESGRVRQLDLGVLNRAALWACAALDYDICLGVVAAAPTGGSSGVLPGAVIAVGEDLGLGEDEIVKALLVGGLVGVFIDHQATFAAETAACQAEIGAASAMAGAAAVQLLGGTPEQAFRAAALSLQNMLGLICDPVAGVGNVPCVSRNAAGAANALVSANMVMAGFDPCLPLDEVIQAMMSVGGMLPAELRCTGRGGLCLSPTARKISRELDLTPAL